MKTNLRISQHCRVCQFFSRFENISKACRTRNFEKVWGTFVSEHIRFHSLWNISFLKRSWLWIENDVGHKIVKFCLSPSILYWQHIQLFGLLLFFRKTFLPKINLNYRIQCINGKVAKRSMPGTGWVVEECMK